MFTHLKITSSQISPYVLLPGDPGRVDVIGRSLADFQILSSNREFRVGLGRYQGLPVTVCSTGIGCPSTAIAVEELIAAGAQVLIRVGTCGGAWQERISIGSLVIPTATVRDEGTTQEYLPLGFPAVADSDVVSALRQAVKKKGGSYFVGINRTHDAFYSPASAITKWGQYLLSPRWQGKDTPILSSEMECAALFVIASLYQVRAGAVLAVDAAPEPLIRRLQRQDVPVVGEADPETTEKIVDQAIIIALEALINLAQERT